MTEVLNSRISIDEPLERLRASEQGRRQVIQNLEDMYTDFTRGPKWVEEGLGEIQYRIVEVFVLTRRRVAEKMCVARKVGVLMAGRIGSRYQPENFLTTTRKGRTVENIMIKTYQNRKRRPGS